MNASTSALIASVNRRRALWDPNDVNHHNRVVVWGLWQEVGAETGLTMVQAKSKWRGLRDYYRQQLRSRTEEAKYRSSWAHFQDMSFLECTMPRKRAAPGIFTKDEPHSPEINTPDVCDQKWDSGWADPSAPPQPDHRPYARYPDSEVSEQEDDDLHFFKSLLPDVRDLPRRRKAFVRLRIQELIFKEVYGGSKIDSTRVSRQEDEESG